MPRRADRRWRGAAALALTAALALPALAQDRPESILPPGFGEPPPPAQNNVAPAPAPPAPDASPIDDLVEAVRSLTEQDLAATAAPAAPPPEYPASAQRDPNMAGILPPASVGLSAQPWGTADGNVLTILLRQMDAPLASRWLHMGLRGALMVQGPPPFGVDPADWAAERAWLLLRMGEADGARLLVSSVDTNDFTPKMVQVAAQTALATGDPAGLCAIEGRLASVETKIAPLAQAMCASLAGESERAAAEIDAARRRGTMSGIDLALADKVVGAGAETRRAVTVEWEPVQSLNAWRYGLASATGLLPPDRLVDGASPQLRSWMARAPMFAATQKIEVARTAAALGVLSSTAYVDLYSAAFDATDPDDLGDSEYWKLRQAYVGKDVDARLAAMRALWAAKSGKGDERFAAQILTARAASLVPARKAYAGDAPDLIASMLAAGYDQAAARWVPLLDEMNDDDADRAWAMLALGAPSANGIDLSVSRLRDFAKRDKSDRKHRTALLVAGLAGLGRISGETVGDMNQRFGLGLARSTGWTRLIDSAAARRQAGTALILAASGVQGGDITAVPGLYLFHGTNALRRVGLEFLARMTAAEALARA